jgi:hypothetical protein
MYGTKKLNAVPSPVFSEKSQPDNTRWLISPLLIEAPKRDRGVAEK